MRQFFTVRNMVQLAVLAGVVFLLSGCSGAPFSLDPGGKDVSVNILQSILGVSKSNFLSGPQTTMFGTMFRYFNTALLCAAGTLFTYIAIAGTLYTAQDGQFLGRKWSSAFLPIRSVGGVAAIVPHASGFCFAQYIIISMAYIGIGLANYVWTEVAKQVSNSYTPPAISEQLKLEVSNVISTLISAQNVYGSPTIKKRLKPCHGLDAATEYCVTMQGQDQPVSMTAQYMQTLHKQLMKPTEEVGLCSGATIEPAYCVSKVKHMAQFNQPAYTSLQSQFLSQVILSTGQVTGGTFKIQRAPLPHNNFVKDLDIQKNRIPAFQMVAAGTCYTFAQDGVATGCSGSSGAMSSLTTRALAYVIKHAKDQPAKPKHHSSIANCGDNPQNQGAISDGGWWCASNRYLNLDHKLGENLKAVYAELDNLKILEPAPTAALTGGSVLIKGSFNIAMTTPGNPALLDPVSGGHMPLSLTLKPISRSYGAAWSTYYNVINDYQYDKSSLWTQKAVNALAYLQLPTTNLRNLSSNYSTPYMVWMELNSGGAAAINKTAIRPEMVIKLANLVAFLHDSDVSNAFLLPANGPANRKVIGSGLYGVLNSIFNHLLSNGVTCSTGGFLSSGTCAQPKTNTENNSGVTSLMSQIYALGTENIPKVNGKPNFVAGHFSVIAQAQEVGFSLIAGTINAMTTIYSHYTDELTKIRDQAKTNAKNLSTWGVVAGFIPGLGGVATYTGVKDQVALSIELAGIATTLMWLPLAIFVLTAVFVAGISFAFLIPMTPYILFWAGKVTWILLIIEALVAAPIMAMGIVYPDGHDVFGQAEPGVKMAINLLLMPVLMIVGLLVGMSLTYIVIHFSAEGFHAVAGTVMTMLPSTANGNATEVTNAQGVVACFMVLTYSTFIVMAFNECFSTIYLIPEKVLKWIGVEGQKFGEKQAGEFKQATMQSAKEGAQAGGQSLQQGIQAQQGEAKAQGEGSIEEGKAKGKAEGDMAGAGVKAIVSMIPK
jgi:hypothetical protein